MWSLADFERDFKETISNHSDAFDLNDEGIILVIPASLRSAPKVSVTRSEVSGALVAPK